MGKTMSAGMVSQTGKKLYVSRTNVRERMALSALNGAPSARWDTLVLLLMLEFALQVLKCN